MTPFDVALVPFPFSDLSHRKKRPCLILSVIKPTKLRTHYVIAMITSNISGLHFPHDVTLKEWETAGLPKPSIVRVAKIVTIDENLIDKKLGRLHSLDSKKVIKEMGTLFKLET